MANSPSQPPHNPDLLIEPPLIDSLHYERDADGFSIALIPSSGEEATQTLFIPRDSSEGRNIAARLYRIQHLIGNRLEKITHLGGSDYTLRLAGGASQQISLDTPVQGSIPEVLHEFKQIAMTAESAFNSLHAGHS